MNSKKVVTNNNTEITTYRENDGTGPLALRTRSLNSNNDSLEQIFMSVTNGLFKVNHMKTDGNWEAAYLLLKDLVINSAYVSDLNAYSDNCIQFGRYGSDTANAPDQWGAFIQIGHCQIAFGGGSATQIYSRRKQSTSWTSWKATSLSVPGTYTDNTNGITIWSLGGIGILTYISPNSVTGAGSGADKLITTLPEGWRPKGTTASVCAVVNGGSYPITLLTNGKLNIYNMTGSGYIKANLVYALA